MLDTRKEYPKLDPFERELRELKFFLSGHFVFSHGWHSPEFADGEILPTKHPAELRDYCRRLQAKLIASRVTPPDVVVGPERGGTIIAAFMAADLAACFVPALKDGNNGYVLDDRFAPLVRGANVILADDVISTLGTLNKVALAVRKAGGNVIGCAAIWEWQNGERRNADGLGAITTLGGRALWHWSAHECERMALCAQGVAISTIHGHGAAYLAEKVREKERGRARA